MYSSKMLFADFFTTKQRFGLLSFVTQVGFYYAGSRFTLDKQTGPSAQQLLCFPWMDERHAGAFDIMS